MVTVAFATGINPREETTLMRRVPVSADVSFAVSNVFERVGMSTP
jgi:hypothetical protein